MAIVYNADGLAGKVCNTCKDWKPLSEFHRYSQARDGYKVRPLTQGGSDWITNIQPLCHTCNSSKNNKSIDYRVNWDPTDDISSKTSADQ